jgi:hypothetical protein
MTHEEFIDAVKIKKWVLGVTDFRQLFNSCNGKISRMTYLIIYWTIFIIFGSHCILLAVYDGWGNIIGIPLLYWMLRIGRPNLSLFDGLWIAVVTMIFIGLASLINWRPSPYIAPVGLIPFMLIGLARFALLDKLTKVLLLDKELYEKLTDKNIIIVANMK